MNNVATTDHSPNFRALSNKCYGQKGNKNQVKAQTHIVPNVMKMVAHHINKPYATFRMEQCVFNRL